MTSSSLPQRIIGLTGGIGMGKSTVSQYLATAHHIPVLDADVYAKEAVEPGSPILDRIAERYGAQLLYEDGSLNRQAMGEIVFQQPDERQWLEQQIHPYVRDRFRAELQTLDQKPVVVLAIPLLFEAHLTQWVNEIWVVHCSEEQQLQRIRQRDQLSAEQAIARIKSQMPIADKIAQADIVLDNSSTLEHLLQQIDEALGIVRLGS